MTLISDIVASRRTSKNSILITVSPDDTIARVVTLMKEKDVGAVVIINNQHQPIGIISERDLVRTCLLKRMNIDTVTASTVMTQGVISMTTDDPFDKCLNFINTFKIRHIPIVDREGQLVDVLSVKDVLDECARIIPGASG